MTQVTEAVAAPEKKEKSARPKPQILTPKGVIETVGMVRISINLYPNQRHLIPDWVQERERYEHRHFEKPKGIPLFDIPGHVDLLQIEAALSMHDFFLNRCHKKLNDGLGSTSQLMLVHEKGAEEMPAALRRQVLYPFFGYQDGKGGLGWKVKAFQNEAIARVPAHIYIQCGNGRDLKDEEKLLDVSRAGAFMLKEPAK